MRQYETLSLSPNGMNGGRSGNPGSRKDSVIRCLVRCARRGAASTPSSVEPTPRSVQCSVSLQKLEPLIERLPSLATKRPPPAFGASSCSFEQ
eukprot:6710099-Pyramimonas_sp.AAC.2